MPRNNATRAIVAMTFLLIACNSGFAQQTVYEWVDKDGVVHFSDTRPGESEAIEIEEITTNPTTPAVTPAQTARSSRAAVAMTDESAPVPAAVETPPLVNKTDITTMSLADLDKRCDTARETMIAPLRAAEIESCKQDKRNDPAWCERFNADFGEGGRTTSGSIRPRMFDDISECVDAQNERNRRRR